MKHLLLALALVSGTLLAADATGTWTGTLTPANDNGPGPAHLVLKQEGETLTGTAGPTASDQRPIQNGKAVDGILTFEVQAGDATMKFALKQEGEEASGDVTRAREGEVQTAKLAVKRTR